MLLPVLLEGEPQSGVIWYEIFRQSPKSYRSLVRHFRGAEKIPRDQVYWLIWPESCVLIAYQLDGSHYRAGVVRRPPR